MAKNEGKKFEEQWAKSCKEYGFYYEKLIDSNKFGQGISGGTRFTPENKYDSYMYKYPYFFTLELKSSQDTGMSFNGKTPWEKLKGKVFMIKPHQVKGLMEASKHEGVISGLILNFREKKLKTITKPNEVYFIYIDKFVEFATTQNKTSVNRDDAKKIGLLITGIKKRTTYTYDIAKFKEEIINLLYKKEE